MPRPPQEKPAPSAGLSIGALSRACSIPVATLRTWESRYGYPQPERRDSGHRVYPVASVARLRRVAEAIARGHRASHVLTASEADLQALLGCDRAASPAARSSLSDVAAADPAALLQAVRAFDGGSLCQLLTAQWSRLGPLAFLEGCLVPLIRTVGDEWAGGRLQIRHEHFLSQRVEDLLRALRHPYEERARGPLVVLATLPGELHGLGLQMAALALSVAGCVTCVLGTDTPVEQIAESTTELGARAVAVSVSAAGSARAARAQLRTLRATVPHRTTVIAGGSGAAAGVERVTVIATFSGLTEWAATVVS